MGAPVVAVVDVGGTTIKGAVVDPSATVLARLDRPVADVAPEGLVDAVVDHVRAVVRRAEAYGGAAAAGLAVPGLVDVHAGVGTFSLILGWRDVPFVRLLDDLGLPLAFGHDVSAGAYAEARLGAARGHTDWLFLALGTGVGSTFVLHDRPYLGAHGYGGELAHVVVRPDGLVCRCGKRGCLETVVTGPAVAEAYGRATGTVVHGSADVARRAEAGDPHAVAVWDDAVTALADAVATYAETMNPSLVVVGGGVAGTESLLVRPLAAALGSRVRFTQPSPAVVAARHGADAALLGVAARAHELLGDGAAFGVPFFPSPAPDPARAAAGSDG